MADKKNKCGCGHTEPVVHETDKCGCHSNDMHSEKEHGQCGGGNHKGCGCGHHK
ncbi:MAG: hypothetical protein SCK29_01240 [Bacillota bacterium]|nr:hypothetical protein [Bacillota bacterium]MDW7682725.1 hypothetical protein [Bacillota bacterium]